MAKINAKIVISTIDYNNSVITLDDNGNPCSPPIPEPVDEEYIVQLGGSLELRMCGVYDAVHIDTVRYIDTL